MTDFSKGLSYNNYKLHIVQSSKMTNKMKIGQSGKDCCWWSVNHQQRAHTPWGVSSPTQRALLDCLS